MRSALAASGWRISLEAVELSGLGGFTVSLDLLLGARCDEIEREVQQLFTVTHRSFPGGCSHAVVCCGGEIVCDTGGALACLPLDEVAVVARIVLDDHDVGCRKGVLQPGNRGWCILPSFFLHMRSLSLDEGSVV